MVRRRATPASTASARSRGLVHQSLERTRSACNRQYGPDPVRRYSESTELPLGNLSPHLRRRGCKHRDRRRTRSRLTELLEQTNPRLPGLMTGDLLLDHRSNAGFENPSGARHSPLAMPTHGLLDNIVVWLEPRRVVTLARRATAADPTAKSHRRPKLRHARRLPTPRLVRRSVPTPVGVCVAHHAEVRPTSCTDGSWRPRANDDSVAPRSTGRPVGSRRSDAVTLRSACIEPLHRRPVPSQTRRNHLAPQPQHRAPIARRSRLRQREPPTSRLTQLTRACAETDAPEPIDVPPVSTAVWSTAGIGGNQELPRRTRHSGRGTPALAPSPQNTAPTLQASPRQSSTPFLSTTRSAAPRQATLGTSRVRRKPRARQVSRR